MAAVNQVKELKFEFNLNRNLAVNINQGFCLLFLADEVNDRKLLTYSKA